MKNCVFFLVSIFILLLHSHCSKNLPENINSTDIAFTDPAIRISISDDTLVMVNTNPISFHNAIEKVVFIINGKTVQTIYETPFQYNWSDLRLNEDGIYKIEVIAYNFLGERNSTETLIENFKSRLNYLGHYRFRVINEEWRLGKPNVYDTTFYDGNIRKYISSDDATILIPRDDTKENPLEKITIEFKENTKITTRLKNDGTFVEKYGLHYCQSGAFITMDSIQCTVGCLGALGGGNNYFIQGVRK